MNCKLAQRGDHIVIDVDGEYVLPSAYMTYDPIKDNYDDFRKAGTRLFFFGAYATDHGINSYSQIKPFRRNFFIAEDTYDFTQVFEDLAMICKDGVYVIPRVYLDCPKWWEESHKDELAKNYAGVSCRQSFASSVWREDMAKALCALIDAIEASEYAGNVIGYQVASGGTEEWTYHGYRYPGEYMDYSDVNTIYFNKWLEKKNGVKSNTPIPTPMQRRKDTCEEFYEYHSFLIQDTIAYFCRVIKEKTNYKRLTGAFYGYLCELVDKEKGHNCLLPLLESKDIDFFASPISYAGCRSSAADWPFMSCVHSAKLHKKLWFTESDVRTNLTRSLEESIPSAYPDNGNYLFEGVWKGPDNVFTSLMNIKRVFGKVLASHTALWWFDMWGGWYADKIYMDFYAQAIELQKRSIECNSKPIAQVAVFVDDKSLFYNPPGSTRAFDTIYKQRLTLGSTGAPYELYMAEDIADDGFDIGRFKVCIFLNCIKLSDKAEKALENKMLKSDKTIIFSGMHKVYTAGSDACNVIHSPYTSEMPFDYLRDIYTLSGVHVFNREGCVIDADSVNICLYVPTVPEKKEQVNIRLYMPKRCSIYDAMTNELLSEDTDVYDFKAYTGETKLFSYYPEPLCRHL